MPAYKNRPSMDSGTPVWRYMRLDALIATLRNRQLRFTRVDKFEDPFEGSVPKQTIDDQGVVIRGSAQMWRWLPLSLRITLLAQCQSPNGRTPGRESCVCVARRRGPHMRAAGPQEKNPKRCGDSTAKTPIGEVWASQCRRR
jgi:hypothetical protein